MAISWIYIYIYKTAFSIYKGVIWVICLWMLHLMLFIPLTFHYSQGTFCLRVGGKLFQAINEIGASKPTSGPVKNSANAQKNLMKIWGSMKHFFCWTKTSGFKKWLKKKAGKKKHTHTHIPSNKSLFFAHFKRPPKKEMAAFQNPMLWRHGASL